MSIKIVGYAHSTIKETFGNKFSRDIREKCLHLITVRYKRSCFEAIESDSFVFCNGRVSPYRDGWPISKRHVKKHLLRGDLSLWGTWGRFANRFQTEKPISPAEILDCVACDLGLSPREKVNLFRHRLTDYEKNTSQENRVSCNLQVAQLFPDLAEECDRQNSGRSKPSESTNKIVRKRPLGGAQLYEFSCHRRSQSGSGPIFAVGSSEQAGTYCRLLNSVDKYTAASWWYKNLTTGQPADFPGIEELDPPLLSDLIFAW